MPFRHAPVSPARESTSAPVRRRSCGRGGKGAAGRFPGRALTILTAALVLCADPAAAQLTQLSDFTSPDSYVRDFRPAGSTGRIVFDEDVNASGTFSPDVRNVFSVIPNQPGSLVRLNNLVSSFGERILDWKVSPDGTRVVMRGDLIGNGITQLFTASTTQPGTQVRLDTNTGTGQNYEVFQYEFTPDSSRVVFRARIDGAYRLLSSPTSGGSAVNVSPVSGNDVQDFRLLQNSAQVVYRADLFDGTDELYLASVSTAGTSSRLTEVAAGTAEVASLYEVSPNGNDLVFAVNLLLQNRQQLLRRAINPTGTQTSLTISGPSGSGIRALLPPDNAGSVQFVADIETHNQNKVYAKISSVLDPFIISSNTANPAGTVTAGSLTRTPDGSRVLYLGNLTAPTRIDLYSSSVSSAGTQVRISSPTFSFAEIFKHAVTPDGSRAVYSGTLEESGRVDLYSASTTAAGTQVKLYQRQATEDVVNWSLSPDGSQVIFTVSRTAPSAGLDVWTAPVDGSSAATLAAPFTGLGFTVQTKVGYTGSGVGIVGGSQLYTLGSPVAPVLTLAGKKLIRTSGSRVILKGRATGDNIQRVEATYRNVLKRKITKSIRPKADGTWRFVYRPPSGRSVIKFRAVDAAGRSSTPVKAVVIRSDRN